MFSSYGSLNFTSGISLRSDICFMARTFLERTTTHHDMCKMVAFNQINITNQSLPHCITRASSNEEGSPVKFCLSRCSYKMLYNRHTYSIMI